MTSAIATLALATAIAQTPTAEFAFHKDGDVGTFRATVHLGDVAKRGGIARLVTKGTSVFLALPQVQPVASETLEFAGRYGRGGDFTLGLRHEWSESGGTRASETPLRVTFPEKAPDDSAGVGRALALAEGEDARRLLAMLPDDSFAQFVVLRARRRFGLFEKDRAPEFLQQPARTPDLYDAFTGALSMQEALQLDVVLRPAEAHEEKSLDVKTLRPPALVSHPFDEKRRGREPRFLDSARFVPEEFWCAQFTSMESLLDAADLADDWAAHGIATWAGQTFGSGLAARFEPVLALRTDATLRPFYKLGVSDVAVCGSDPFVLEGSDLTILFHLRSRPLFETHLRELRAERKAAVPGAVEKKETIAGFEVEALVSPDRAVSSWLSWVDDWAIVSSSRAAIARVLAAHAGQAPSLASAPDFRCLRAIDPQREGEDAFVFVSDAFVRRVVGPELKITEARRVRCVASLRTIENAALLFRMENARDPRDLVELWPDTLDTKALWCPGGGAYEFGPGGARCLVHGSLAALTPCLEIATPRVTDGESREYDRFVRRYNDYWTQYFDPVGISLRLGDVVTADTTILPLVENSAYDTIRRWIGGAAEGPLSPPPASSIASVSGRVDLRSVLPDEITQRMVREKWGVDVGRAATDAFGPEVALRVGDGSLRFDFRIEKYLSTALAGGRASELFLAPVLASLSLPVSVAIGVRDPAAAKTFVGELREALQREGASRPVLPSVPRFSTYALEPYDRMPIEVIVLEALASRVRFFHALTPEAWIVSNDEAFLRAALDQRHAKKSASSEAAHARLDLVPSAWQLARSALLLAYEESASEACRRNLGPATAVERALGESDEASRAALERRAFGTIGACPDGGRYAPGSDGLAECSVHGGLRSAKQLREPAPTSTAARILKTLRAMSVQLRFTDDGLHTRVTIERGT